MQKRSLGVTAMAFGSVMVGLYCQYAAIALIFAGSIFTPTGSAPAAVALMLGALFLGLTFAAYFLGYGLWTCKHWSWAGSIALFGVLIGANVVLSAMSSSWISSLLPIVVGAVAVWFLTRPATRTELLGEASATRDAVRVATDLGGAEPVR